MVPSQQCRARHPLHQPALASKRTASKKPPTPAASPTPSQVSALLPTDFCNMKNDDRLRFIESLLSVCDREVISGLSEYVAPLLKRDPFSVLPIELSLRILSYIKDPQTLARASQVSKLWHLVLSDDLTWKGLCGAHHFRRMSAISDRQLQHHTNTNAGGSDCPIQEEELTEAVYDPAATRRSRPTSYRSHFKQQYLLNSAWNSKHGGRIAARYVISNPGVVTSLLMIGRYIVIALDNSKIYVFREDGRMLRSLYGHVMGVWALALAGDTLVSGGCDRDVRVWDLSTGQCTQILRGHSSTVRCIQMCGAKRAISGSRDNTIRVWDIERGVCERVLEGHESAVRCIEVHNDILVSGSYDFKAKVWRISTGELLHTLEGHFSQIYSLAFDGNRIATGALDATVRVWDPKTGACLATLQGHTSLVGQLQLRDNTLVSGGSDGAVRVWNLDRYECVHRFAAHDNSVTSLQFDDNRIVSGGSDGRVRVWNMETGLHMRDMEVQYDAVWRVAFKDEKIVVLASRNGKIYMELTSFIPPEDSSAALPVSPAPINTVLANSCAQRFAPAYSVSPSTDSHKSLASTSSMSAYSAATSMTSMTSHSTPEYVEPTDSSFMRLDVYNAAEDVDAMELN